MESGEVMHMKHCLYGRIGDKKGISLIELMVVIAISGMLITAVGMILLSNQQSSSYTKNLIDAQMQGEQVLNLITGKVMEAGTVIQSAEVPEEFRVVKYADLGSTHYQYDCFRYDAEGRRILYATYNSTGSHREDGRELEIDMYQEIANSIDAFTIKLLPTNAVDPLEDYNGIAIQIVVKKEDVTKSYSTQVFCRNWPLS